MSNKSDVKSKYKRRAPYKYGGPVGMCLGCGERLTLCGVQFTLDVHCDKCNSINVYIDSQQPLALRQQRDRTCSLQKQT